MMNLGKKNIIIVGESGTGRRNLLKGFINKAKNSEVPFELEEVKIKELNLDLLVSGIKYKGSIEVKHIVETLYFDVGMEKLKSLMKKKMFDKINSIDNT